MDLVRWCYPRLKGSVRNKNRFATRRAAEAVAVKIGRTYPGGFIWVGKESNELSGTASRSLPSDDENK
jgi:hypothetical protein